jgi:5S rRNA maturation endonuclease (ribonuclease M5)
MSPSRDQDRLVAIERVLDELRDRPPEAAIIVEGDRDVSALEALGVPHPIVKLNLGVSLLNLCEDLARKYEAFIILTDWDKKGSQLAKRLEELFRTTGVKVDPTTRRRLGGTLPYQIHDVESLSGHVERLRNAVRLHDEGTLEGPVD